MTSKRFTKALAAAAGVGALALAGCSSTSPVDPGTEPADDEIGVVGLMVQDISNPFFAAMQSSMEEVAEEEGFTLNVQDGQQDLGAQNEQIDAFIQQQVDIILLNAVDSEGIGSAVQRALDAGITVVAVDVDAAGAQAAVTTDNVEAGRQACTALFEKMGGQGNILIVDGTPITSVQERVEGCEEVLAEHPDITVLAHQNGNNDRATGLDLTTQMLTANDDVQGIFAINDPTALGATLALGQANREGVWVVGVDGSPEAVEAMQDDSFPNSSFWATPAQDPGGMVVEAFEVAKDIRANGAPDEDERIMLVEPSLVTRDTVSDYAGW
ncbi:ABC transporter substrate-binding protein [Microbacterium sp. Marseille-Q6965]|uniref:ABC transporter substrate-binding protein n=1 Tax=Microbacterium sp. Marseille-Q6965 TaxID=2965072 RepID=UPI0021B7EEB7|nr:ABC transporter substrate-binding protein [Microbacterium sp. Marseille-Q6965]